MRQAFKGTDGSKSIRFFTSVALVALVAGCQGASLGGNTGGDATRAAPGSESIQLIERDVEAPEVFSAEDRALWDGRPSLGGVWVAAPDVRDPERVIIRNADNGKFVIGALFKRERPGNGPALQLSSDAAAALGILAGSPTTVDVVALRREESAAPTPAPAASAPQAVAESQAAPLAEEIVETAAVPDAADDGPDSIAAASAALDSVESAETASAGVTAATAPSGTATVSTPAGTPRQGNFLTRLFKRRSSSPAAMPDQSVMPEAVDQAAASGAATPTVTATSLNAAPVRTASVAPTAPSSGGLDLAYVQIGIFSIELNARNTATALSGQGIVPTVLEGEARGRKFWRVIVGPSTTPSDRAAVIRKAKSMGFTDAFAVRS